MDVRLDKEVAEELIIYKLRRIQELISDILTRWNETVADSFLRKARDGTYAEAENDAIELRQLLLEEEKLQKLLESLNQEGNLVFAEDNIRTARNLLVATVLHEIKDIFVDDERPLLKVTFLTGFILYIRFNDFNEYSYQIIFSQRPNDRLRYDNFDDRWPVRTRPHHLHPRHERDAIESLMTGIPEHDIPILIKVIFPEE